MARPPESAKTSLRQRLAARARERWPQLADITVRYHGEFAYVAGQLPDGTTLAALPAPLRRIRHQGASPSTAPAMMTTRSPSCPAASQPAPPRKPSTAPAACTSVTRRPGSTCHPGELKGATTRANRMLHVSGVLTARTVRRVYGRCAQIVSGGSHWGEFGGIWTWIQSAYPAGGVTALQCAI
jgi:hypothetical protein